jgi:hypothetical protein
MPWRFVSVKRSAVRPSAVTPNGVLVTVGATLLETGTVMQAWPSSAKAAGAAQTNLRRSKNLILRILRPFVCLMYLDAW